MIRRLSTSFWQWWYRQHPSPSRFSKDEALAIARKHNLEAEVVDAMNHGCNPDEALEEWDLFPYMK